MLHTTCLQGGAHPYGKNAEITTTNGVVEEMSRIEQVTCNNGVLEPAVPYCVVGVFIPSGTSDKRRAPCMKKLKQRVGGGGETRRSIMPLGQYKQGAPDIKGSMMPILT